MFCRRNIHEAKRVQMLVCIFTFKWIKRLASLLPRPQYSRFRPIDLTIFCRAEGFYTSLLILPLHTSYIRYNVFNFYFNQQTSGLQGSPLVNRSHYNDFCLSWRVYCYFIELDYIRRASGRPSESRSLLAIESFRKTRENQGESHGRLVRVGGGSGVAGGWAVGLQQT